MKNEGLARTIRTLIESERLEDLPEPTGEKAHRSFLSRLLETEELPIDEPVEPLQRRVPFLTRLFARETLPEDAVVASGRKGGHSRRDGQKTF